jgi:hypothetical protein
MASLTGNLAKDTYTWVLHVGSATLTALRKIYLGSGVESSLSISETAAKVTGDLDVTGGITGPTITNLTARDANFITVANAAARKTPASYTAAQLAVGVTAVKETDTGDVYLRIGADVTLDASFELVGGGGGVGLGDTNNWTGPNDFSNTVTHGNQDLTNNDSSLNLRQGKNLRFQMPNVLQYGIISSFNSGGTTTLNSVSTGSCYIATSTTNSAHANVWYSDGFLLESASSSVGVKFNRSFSISQVFHWAALTTARTAQGRIFLLIGGTAAVYPASDANQFTAQGLGFELAVNNDGVNVQCRLIYHDGTTPKQSAWVNIWGATTLANTFFTYAITNNGTGGVDFYIKSSTSGATDIIGETAVISITDGPTTNATIGNHRRLCVVASNPSSGTTVGIPGCYFYPPIVKIN